VAPVWLCVCACVTGNTHTWARTVFMRDHNQLIRTGGRLVRTPGAARSTQVVPACRAAAQPSHHTRKGSVCQRAPCSLSRLMAWPGAGAGGAQGQAAGLLGGGGVRTICVCVWRGGAGECMWQPATSTPDGCTRQRRQASTRPRLWGRQQHTGHGVRAFAGVCAADMLRRVRLPGGPQRREHLHCLRRPAWAWTTTCACAAAVWSAVPAP
jgi:hypothetical protein